MNTIIKGLIVKVIFTASFTLILFLHLYSQKKIFTGYYINTSNDTVKGVFSNYEQWIKTPVTVPFIPSATSTPIELNAQNTIKFYVENYDTYLSYNGQRMINPIDFEEAIANKETF